MLLNVLLAVHLAVCLCLLAYSFMTMRRGLTFLNVFVPIFTLCCCIGVNFLRTFEENLPQVAFSDVAHIRTLIANLIFLGGGAAALWFESRFFSQRTHVHQRVIPTNIEAKAVVVFASLFITGFLIFWLSSAAKLENPFAAYTETGGSGQYYEYRKLVEQDVLGTAGRGTWSARKLAFNASPFVLILLAYLFYRSKNWLFLVLLAIQSVPPLFVAGVQAHKSFLVVSLFAPLLALSIWKLKGYSSVLILSILIPVLLIGGTLVFHATLNSTLDVALREFITRIFLVPAMTPLFYYEVVPDALPFRGILNSFFIHHAHAPAWDYSIYDVAHHAVGRPYGANANFLAVGFTGAGFLGVTLVVAVCLLLVVLLDYLLIELEPGHRLVAICCSGFGFVGITSINFLGALENGFLIGTAVFIALCRSSQACSNSDNQVAHWGFAPATQ